MEMPTALPPLNAGQQANGQPQYRVYEPAEVLAVVGKDPILAGDILPPIDHYFEQYIGQVPDEQIAAEREKVIRMRLEREIERKLACLYFLRMVPSEGLPQLEVKIFDAFNQDQLPAMLERAGVETAAELDALLREQGSSIARERQLFRENVMASEVRRGILAEEPEISHEELLTYYRSHQEEYSFPSQVRWEQIMVRSDNYSSKSEAYRVIAEMGNEILRGAPLDVIARRSSEGPRKSEGGQYDWTTKGCLNWRVVDEALFTMPLSRLSPILEDEDSFHIVRVLERRDAGVRPFQEVQGEIQEKILEDYRSEKLKEFLESLKESTVVWTIFDNDPPLSESEEDAGVMAGR